mgnify:CR=1 FL=1
MMQPRWKLLPNFECWLRTCICGWVNTEYIHVRWNNKRAWYKRLKRLMFLCPLVNIRKPPSILAGSVWIQQISEGWNLERLQLKWQKIPLFLACFHVNLKGNMGILFAYLQQLLDIFGHLLFAFSQYNKLK